MGKLMHDLLYWCSLKFWGTACRVTDAREAIRLSSGLLLAIVAGAMILLGAGIALIARGGS